MDLYIGNLSKKTTKEDLEKLFEKYESVAKIKFKKDLFTGESKGYAFVVMTSQSEVEKAIEKLNGKKLKGQIIIVKESRAGEHEWEKGRKDGKPF